MSDPEKFLERWSRRKRVAGELADKAAAAQPGAAESPPDNKPAAAGAPETPVFDPASLPPIESIGAETDLSAFLKPGVPGELKLAALRRAWSVDPAIRDFKGLQENDWNFNDPNGIPGFGELDPSFDVKKMLRDLFGETPRAEEANTELPQPTEQPPSPQQQSITAAADIASVPVSEPAAPAENQSMVQREENIASQNDDEQMNEAQIKRRRSQGRALPQ